MLDPYNLQIALQEETGCALHFLMNGKAIRSAYFCKYCMDRLMKIIIKFMKAENTE